MEAPEVFSEDATDNVSDGHAPKRRDRSTIRFPYRDLVESIDLIRILYSQFGGSCTADQLAAAAGYSGANNGAYTQRLAAVGHFGFMVRDGETLRVTDRGLAALESSTAKQALVDAFLSVPLYQAVYEKFKGQKLPELKGLEKAIRDMGVTDATASSARQVMVRAAKQAGFFDLGEDRLVMPAIGHVVKESESQETPDTSKSLNGGESGRDNDKDMVTVNLRLHKSVVGYIEDLPAKGAKWEQDAFDEWTAAFLGALRYAYKVKAGAHSKDPAKTTKTAESTHEATDPS